MTEQKDKRKEKRNIEEKVKRKNRNIHEKGKRNKESQE